MTRSFAIKGRHVLLAFVLFFGLVFAVNGAFIYFALATHPGDDVKDAYAGGLAFNRELAEKRAQEKLGWQAAISVSPAPGNRQTIELAFTDAAGQPVYGLALEAELRNAVAAGRDHRVAFENAGAGIFRATIAEPRGTRWDIVVEARSTRGEVFRLRHRL